MPQAGVPKSIPETIQDKQTQLRSKIVQRARQMTNVVSPDVYAPYTSRAIAAEDSVSEGTQRGIDLYGERPGFTTAIHGMEMGFSQKIVAAKRTQGIMDDSSDPANPHEQADLDAETDPLGTVFHETRLRRIAICCPVCRKAFPYTQILLHFKRKHAMSNKDSMKRKTELYKDRYIAILRKPLPRQAL